MKNLTIGSKISLGFACLFALLLLIALVAVSFSVYTSGNNDQMELYGGLQGNANELMHILNETRVSAGAFYATHTQDTYDNVLKQLMYCDKRLEKLYEYIDAYPALKDFRKRVESFDALYGPWRDSLRAAGGSYDFQSEFLPDQEEAFASLSKDLRSANLRAHELLSQLGSDIGDLSDKMMRQTKEFGSIALIIVVAISAVALLSAILIAVLLIRSITRPIGRMRDVLIQIGKYGDLRLRADAEDALRRVAAGRDETAQCTSELLVLVKRLEEIDQSLSHVADGDLTAAPSLKSERDTIGLAVVKMLENLNQKFGTIADSTLQVNAKTRELSEDSRLLASGSREQTHTIGNLSESVTRVSQKTEENSALARRAADLTDHIRSTARVGTEKMNQMIQATEDINTANQDIIKVIKVIDDIAFQTNILALNASVEAARAGQHGMGFAVVADEVRNLATKSAVAAKETGVLIEDTAQKAALGASIAKATSVSLQEIVTGVEDSNAIMGDITAFSREQSADIMKIVEDVRHVGQIVEQNNAIAARSASAAADISDQSDLLQGMVAQFTLANKALNAPRAAADNHQTEVGIHA